MAATHPASNLTKHECILKQRDSNLLILRTTIPGMKTSTGKCNAEKLSDKNIQKLLGKPAPAKKAKLAAPAATM
jgi:hypothetical protein